MAPRIKRKASGIESLTDMFDLLGKTQPASEYTHLYRGHPDNTYLLQPSIFRKKEYRRVERNVLRELIALQPNEFRDDKGSFEQLVRMQHYGLPTRLLDLTFNPLVALYFTCSKDKKKDGEFIRLEVRKSSIRHFDSDAVSCVANLSNLFVQERNQLRILKSTTALNDSEAGQRLLRYIRSEKPYFLPKIQLSSLMNIYAVRPKQTNRRILAQQGAFLIFGLKSLLEDANNFGIKILRTKVPASAKKKLLDELDSININESTLFPEIESAAKYIMSKIPVSNEADEQTD